MADKSLAAIGKEIDRLERTGNESMEANWIRTWLDTVFDIPWTQRATERLELDQAREILDADHTGLAEVKDRLVEFLAVRKLRRDRGMTDGDASMAVRRTGGAILALVGPPGVGKTSLGESVPAPSGVTSSAWPSAASATRPRSAAIAAPTSAPGPGGWWRR